MNPAIDEQIGYEKFMGFNRTLSIVPSFIEKGKHCLKIGIAVSFWQEISSMSIKEVLDVLVLVHFTRLGSTSRT